MGLAEPPRVGISSATCACSVGKFCHPYQGSPVPSSRQSTAGDCQAPAATTAGGNAEALSVLAARKREECLEATTDLLQDLERMGRIAVQTVSYLGYVLQQGKRALSQQRIQAILQIPRPIMKRQVWEF